MSEEREAAEVVDGEVVEARRVPAAVGAPSGRALLPVAPAVVQAAAVAATGFLAGAATLTLARHARHARARRAAKVSPRGATLRRGPAIVASRSFMVDVHLLARE